MGKYFNNRKKAGFSTAEVLLTVAIIVVLIGVSVFGVAALKKGLTQKELDSKAQILYVAAQNRLTQMKAAGLTELYTDPAIPQMEQEVDGDAVTLNYVVKEGSASAQAESFLPLDYVDQEIWDHLWAVEYNADSATVYAVYYSETTLGYSPSTRESLIAEATNKTNKVGYYCGVKKELPAAVDTDALHPYIRIENGEVLKAVITCPTPEEMNVGVTFRITVYDEGDNITKYSAVTVTPEADISGVYTYELVLDEITDNMADRFRYRYPDCTPGANIVISVEATPTGEKASSIDGNTVTATTNSLFAGIEEAGDGSITADVKTGRHLQNLDSEAVDVEVKHVLQTSDIDWNESYPSVAFIPIENSDIETYNGTISATEIATIYNLSVDAATLNVSGGLFETYSGTSIESLRLCGTEVIGGSNPAGALIGTFTGSEPLTLTNCQVLQDEDELESAGKTYEDVWIDGSAAGGLIGSNPSGSITISQCFAATVIGSDSTGSAGGLVGSNGGTLNISESYADCYLTGSNVGGLVGSGSADEISSSYAAGYVTAAASGAGLVNGSVGSVSDSYTVVCFTDDCAGDTHAVAASASTVSGAYYLAKGSVKDDIGSRISKTVLSGFASTLGSSFGEISTEQYYVPYNLMEEDSPDYMFPVVADMPHYGDWELTIDRGTLAYYEVYADSSRGFHAGEIDTLKSDVNIVGDGYGLIFDDEPLADILIGTTALELTQKVTISGEEKYFYAFPKSVVNPASAPTTLYSKQTVSCKVTVGSFQSEKTQDYYYNPLFAKTETQCGTAEEYQALVNSITCFNAAIRTPRHLYNLSRCYESGSKEASYLQEKDLDYTAYSWTVYASDAAVSSQKPIGTDAFTDTYDGDGHKIRGISSFTPADGFCGLFGKNKGTIRDVDLIGPEVTVNAGTTTYAGALAAYNDNGGSITDCTVTGYSFSGAGNLGGFAGYNNGGSITDCSVSGNSFSGGSTALGGFIGCNNSGSITNCIAYANTLSGGALTGGFAGRNAGSIGSCSAGAGTMSGSGTVGGFVGSNGAQVQNAYVATLINTAGTKCGGFAGENTGSIANSYSATVSNVAAMTGFAGGTVTNSFYLNHGSYAYQGRIYACSYQDSATQGEPITGAELARQSMTGFSAAGSTLHCNSSYYTTAAYPYPAVVKDQNNAVVHYGDWPVAQYMVEWDGIWDDPSEPDNKVITVDIIRMDDLGMQNKLFCSADELGVDDITLTDPDVVELEEVSDLDGLETSGGTEIGTWRMVTYSVQDAGTTDFVVTIGDQSDTFTLNVTASLIIEADKQNFELEPNKTAPISLSAYSDYGDDYTNRADLEWHFEYLQNPSDPRAAIVKTGGSYEVRGLKEGQEIIMVTASITKNGKEYVSNPIAINVTVASDIFDVTYYGYSNGSGGTYYTVTDCPYYTDTTEAGDNNWYIRTINVANGINFESLFIYIGGSPLEVEEEEQDNAYQFTNIGGNTWTLKINREWITDDVEVYLKFNKPSDEYVSVSFEDTSGWFLVPIIYYTYYVPGTESTGSNYAVKGKDYTVYVFPVVGSCKSVTINVAGRSTPLRSGVDYEYEDYRGLFGYSFYRLTIHGDAITGNLTIKPST